MFTINHTLEKNIIDADGAYLDARALQPLEFYLESYKIRLDTYHHLREQSSKFVLQSLQQLAQEYPELIKRSGKRCQYDMTEVLRYIALSILRDDEVFFTEQMMSWLDTIIVSYKKHGQCAIAYRHLQEIMAESLPPAENNLVRPYIENVISTLQSHA